MATTNNASQTTNASQTNNASQYNTFQGDGYSHNLNYYQVVLTNGNNILLGSNIYTSYTDIEQLRKEIHDGGTKFMINYVTAIPNLGQLNNHLQRNYRTEAGFYCPPSEPSTPNQPIPDPELNPPPAPARPTSSQYPDFIESPCYGSVSTSGSSESDSAFPLPDGSYFSTSPQLEVVGNQIPNNIHIKDEWEHLDGEHLMESFQEDVELFTNMTIEQYGKGYLLVPPDGHEHYGEKYYHKAWWMSKNNAWFFKEDLLGYFLDNGAMWKLEKVNAEDEYSKIFEDMVFEPYSNKGYLLQCYNSHPNYADKHFHGGFWHTQGDGWFFPTNMRSFLEDNGAVFEYNEDILFDGMAFHNGLTRGMFYLIPNSDNKYYGLDGFEGGKWLYDDESWLFTGKDVQYFTSRGCNSTK